MSSYTLAYSYANATVGIIRRLKKGYKRNSVGVINTIIADDIVCALVDTGYFNEGAARFFVDSLMMLSKTSENLK